MRKWTIFAAGFILGLFGIFGPVEELFHWSFSWLSGSPARIIGWTQVSFHHPTLIAALAGPFGEAILLYILTFALLHKSKVWVAVFPFGVAHSQFLLHLSVASDLRVWVPYLIGHGGMVGVLWVWIGLNGVLIIIGWIAVRGVAYAVSPERAHQDRRTKPYCHGYTTGHRRVLCDPDPDL